MKIWISAIQMSHQRKAGYTLAEVMVATAITATMVVSLFAGLSFGFARIETTREDLRATQILAQKLEAIRLCTWTELSNCPTAFQENYNPLGTTNSSTGVTYYGTMAITIPTNIPNSVSYKNDMRLITVTLTWTNESGSSVVHTRQMQTEAASHGIHNYIWGKQ